MLPSWSHLPVDCLKDIVRSAAAAAAAAAAAVTCELIIVWLPCRSLAVGATELLLASASLLLQSDWHQLLLAR